jgi:hypothetical protein
MTERTGAMANGALIALGATAILDNLVAHWLLGLHRAVPDTSVAVVVETALVAVGIACCWSGWSGSGTPGGDNRPPCPGASATATRPDGLQAKDQGATWVLTGADTWPPRRCERPVR